MYTFYTWNLCWPWWLPLSSKTDYGFTSWNMHEHGKPSGYDLSNIWLMYTECSEFTLLNTNVTAALLHSLIYTPHSMGAASRLTSPPNSLVPSLELNTIRFKGFPIRCVMGGPLWPPIRSKWWLSNDTEIDPCSLLVGGVLKTSECEDSDSGYLLMTWTYISICDINHQNPLWAFSQCSGSLSDISVNYSERAPREILHTTVVTETDYVEIWAPPRDLYLLGTSLAFFLSHVHAHRHWQYRCRLP